MRACVFACVRACVYVHVLHECMHVVCMHVCTCTHTHTYTHTTHTQSINLHSRARAARAYAARGGGERRAMPGALSRTQPLHTHRQRRILSRAEALYEGGKGSPRQGACRQRRAGGAGGMRGGARTAAGSPDHILEQPVAPGSPANIIYACILLVYSQRCIFMCVCVCV